MNKLQRGILDALRAGRVGRWAAVVMTIVTTVTYASHVEVFDPFALNLAYHFLATAFLIVLVGAVLFVFLRSAPPHMPGPPWFAMTLLAAIVVGVIVAAGAAKFSFDRFLIAFY